MMIKKKLSTKNLEWNSQQHLNIKQKCFTAEDFILKKEKNINDLDIRPQWLNNIYSFNSSFVKNTPVSYKWVYNILKNYFNLLSPKLIKSINITRTNRRFIHWKKRIKRRLSVNRVFIGKPIIKFTNDLVIINISIFNRIQHFYYRKFNALNKINKINKLTKQSRNLILQNKNFTKQFYKYSLFIIGKSNYISNLNKYNFKFSNTQLYKFCINSILMEKKLIFYYKNLLLINKLKADNIFLLKLNKFLGKIYNKKIMLNILNIKYPYMNSDIFTQVLSLKTRLRKYGFIFILKRSVNSIKQIRNSNNLYYANTNRIAQEFSHEKNKLQTNKYNVTNYDTLETYLKKFFFHWKKHDMTNFFTEKYLLFYTKYKYITGIKIKGKGRLTKRLIAAKSISKFRQKDATKDFRSSYTGQYSPMIRGNNQSNIQYTKLVSKTMNGSFGLTGWFGSQ